MNFRNETSNFEKSSLIREIEPILDSKYIIM